MYELKIRDAVAEVTGLDDVKIGFPPPSMRGDLSTNAAMVSSTDPGRLCAALEKLEEVESAETAGPGVVNITLSPGAYAEELKLIAADPGKYGAGDRRGSILVEMVSSNPTGPLHIGHGRGGAIGDSLARMCAKLGYRVLREYYVNDTGRQMNLLGESIRCALEGRTPPADGYRGEYIKSVADELRGSSVDSGYSSRAGELILGWHLDVLKSFRITYDSVFRESRLAEEALVKKTVESLRAGNLTYEKEGALWFRSSRFGDTQDRVLRKSSGDLTYFASDCAYHLDKSRRAERFINVWGADHHGYTPRIKAFWEASGLGEKELDILLYQLVDLKREGEKVSMSTRQGEFVTLQEVLDEVGADAARFFMLMRSSDAPLEFDLELARRQNSSNPVYYVQYSHARICSVFAKASRSPGELDLKECDPGPEEYPLIKALGHFPYLLEKCVDLKAPHFMTEYLRDVATAFHKYYDTVRVIGSGSRQETRLLLLSGVKGVISSGLELLGVSAPERM